MGDEPVLIDTRTAGEITGLRPGSIRAAVRRGDLDLAALARVEAERRRLLEARRDIDRVRRRLLRGVS